MRVSSSVYLLAFLVSGALFFVSIPASAQDIFLKKDRGVSSQDGGSASKKLYLSPKPGNLARKRNNSNQRQRLYNNATGRQAARSARPSTTVNRNNQLDRIQQANIDAAQAQAVRNAQVLQQMQKTWDAERAAADEEAQAQYMAEQEQEQQGAGSSTESRDMSNATYLKQNPMDAPKRTFDIFR